MSERTMYANVPLPIADAYAMYLQWCAETNKKVVSEDPSTHTITFKSIYPSKTVFSPCPDDRNTNMTLHYRAPDNLADQEGAFTAQCVEPFLTKVNSKLLSDAKSRLVGVAPEQLLHKEQTVNPEVETLLQKSKDHSSAFTRREAIRALGMLPESNQRIVAALILAREGDPHEDARSDAGASLKAPVHQAVIQSNPEWADQVSALGKIAQVDQLKADQVTRANERSGRSWMWTGGLMIFWGIISILMNLVHYELIVMGFIHLSKPIFGILFIMAGIGVIAIGNYQSAKRGQTKRE